MVYYVNDSNDYGNICLKTNGLGSYKLKDLLRIWQRNSEVLEWN